MRFVPGAETREFHADQVRQRYQTDSAETDVRPEIGDRFDVFAPDLFARENQVNRSPGGRLRCAYKHIHAGHMAMSEGLPAEVSFPYGFPKSGDFRIYVQVKRGGAILTGVFDARVEN